MINDFEGKRLENSKLEMSSPGSIERDTHLGNNPDLEVLFRIAFNCVPCHGVIVDQYGTIIAMNKAWRDITQNTGSGEKGTSEGANYLEICEQSQGLISAGGKPFANGLRAVLHRKIDRFEMEYTANDGATHRWFLGRVNGMEIDGKRFAFVLHENISEYKEREFQSMILQPQIPTLLDTVKTVVSTLDLQELLNTILKKLEKLIRYNAAAIFTYETDTVFLQAYQGPPLSDNSPVILSTKGRYPEIHRIVANQYAFFIQNINEIPGLLREISDLLNLDIANIKRFHSWLFLPMAVTGNQIGIMILAHFEKSYYDHDALRLGQIIANYAAIAIQNASLYELSKNTAILQERNRLAYELHDSIAQFLYSMNLYAIAAQNALETEKDEVAMRHLKNLQRLSSEAVKEMRLMIFQLNNQILEEFGMARAIQARFEAIEAKQGIKTDLKMFGKLNLSNHMEREVFGIIQELLIYIEKTTPTKAISVVIETGEDRVLVNITSDQFVDPLENNTDLDVARLNRIRNRVRKMDGNLRFFHSTSRETEIRFDLKF